MTTTANIIDCEVRSLIDEAQYHKLKAFFSNVAELVSEGSQETRYFEGPHDLRIQKSDTHAKVWLKRGSLLEGNLEETELRLEPEHFEKLEKLFDGLEYKTAVVWKRHRLNYAWDDVTVSLDHTKGYGYVVEMRLQSEDAIRLETLDKLREKLAMLGLKPTPKPVMHERFSYYREHWRELINEETKTPA